ncbi:MAG: hypothetical protein ACYC0H_21125 [Solirubrobacteraceae bacterium]
MSRLAKLVMESIEALPAVQAATERSRRSRPFTSEAGDAAYSSGSDEELVAELRARVPDDDFGLEAAIEQTARDRSNFINDRAHRLLRAISEGGPVIGIDPAVADLFQQEQALGRLPLREAFARLAEHDPGLLELDGRDDVTSSPDVTDLVGIKARSHDPLLMSDISASIVMQYLDAVNKERSHELEAPYFESRRMGWTSFATSTGPTRPNATN